MLSKDLLQQFEDNITRFDENIHAFENGEIDRQTFKGISGGFGSYAQKEQGYMLRLRLPGGHITKEKLKFLADKISEHQISLLKLTTFPDGFPDSLIHEFEEKTGHKVLCNKPYSGTQVLKDYGEQAMKENALIVYTSADSVFQVAANEELVPVHELYRYCEIAREMLKGEYGVGRVIARPFLGRTADTFYRTTNRHDLSLKPPRKTMLDLLKDAGRDVIAVGKIFDIFDGEGVTEKIKTTGNTNGIAFTKALQTRDFEGLAFVNLVDFDMLYGHRRDVAGYAAAATEFDKFVADFIPGMREGDILMVTADHGCDPSYTKTTDHTREYVPYLICGKGVKPGVDLGTRLCFGTIAQTICDYLGVDASTLDGQSVLGDILA